MAADAARYGNSIEFWYCGAFSSVGNKATTTSRNGWKWVTGSSPNGGAAAAIRGLIARSRHTSALCFALLSGLVPTSGALRSVKEALLTGVPEDNLLSGEAFPDFHRPGTHGTGPACRDGSYLPGSGRG